MKLTLKRCEYCRNEPEPGWIDTDDNGPIVPCPVCNQKTRFEREFDKAVAARRTLSEQSPAPNALKTIANSAEK